MVDLNFRDGRPEKAQYSAVDGNQKSQGDHHRLGGAKTRRFSMGETTNLAGFQPSKVLMVQSYPDGKTT